MDINHFVVIPYSIYYDKNLTDTAKFLFHFISSDMSEEGYCIKSNKELSELLNKDEATIKRGLRSLKDQEYIEEIDFDGRIRKLKTCIFDLNWKVKKNENSKNSKIEVETAQKCAGSRVKNALADSAKMRWRYNIYNNTNNNILNTVPSEQLPRSAVQKENRKKLDREILDDLQKKNHTPIYDPLDTPIGKEAVEVVDLWNEAGLKPLIQNKAPKTYQKAISKIIKAFKGKITGEKITIDDFATAINRFALSALDEDFEPSDIATKKKLKAISLNDFIYNNFYKSQKSLLLKYLTEEPVPSKTAMIEDPNPAVTKKIKRFYLKYVFGNLRKETDKTEENAFRKTTLMLQKFYAQNKRQFRMNIPVSELADYLFKAIENAYGDRVSRIFPMSLCSKFAEGRLMAVLNEHGLVEDAKSQGWGI